MTPRSPNLFTCQVQREVRHPCLFSKYVHVNKVANFMSFFVRARRGWDCRKCASLLRKYKLLLQVPGFWELLFPVRSLTWLDIVVVDTDFWRQDVCGEICLTKRFPVSVCNVNDEDAELRLPENGFVTTGSVFLQDMFISGWGSCFQIQKNHMAFKMLFPWKGQIWWPFCWEVSSIDLKGQGMHSARSISSH